ncbi:Hypothetical protein A7982_03625 [Minicystis rosea]|nr:Hypothetical protein A7982_03625 [Minicystis rosea]
MPSPRKASPPRRKILWLVLPPVLVFVGLALYGLFVGYHVAVKPGDRERLVTIEDITARLPAVTRAASAPEKLERLWHTDASIEISYEYDGAETATPVYITSTVSQSLSSRDAAGEYFGYTAGVKVGAAVSGAGLKETPRDDLLKWGDESRSTVLVSDGQPAGNYFIARKGSRIFIFMVSGVCFEEPEAFRALILPRLERMAASSL